MGALAPLAGPLVQYKNAEPEGYVPLLLCTFSFYGTSVTLNVCTVQNDYNGEQESLTINGVQYLTRVVSQNLQAIQGMSGTGLDIFPNATITLANGDSLMWSFEAAWGFKGATMTLTRTLWEPRTNTFTNDPSIAFQGVCDPASCYDVPRQNGEIDSAVQINARSVWDFNRKLLPIVPDERRCSLNFPATLTARQFGFFTPYPFNQGYCPYSADIAGGYGNLNGSAPYTTCDYSKTSCQARGMYAKDNKGNATAFFNGNTYNTPALWSSKSYLQGKTIKGVNNSNLGQFTQHYPEVFGAVWVEAAIELTTFGDGNSSRWEAAVCVGDVNSPANDFGTIGIAKVEVNGILIPKAGSGVDVLMCYYIISSGSNSGNFTGGAGYVDGNGNPVGDPHGGICKLLVVVYNELADANSIPTIRVLVGDAGSAYGSNGRAIPVFTDNSGQNFSLQRSDLTPDVIVEVMRRMNIDVRNEVDLDYYLAARQFAARMINYTNIDGTVAQHRVYGVSLYLEPTQQYQGGNLIQSLRLASNLLMWMGANGKIRMRFKMGLAETHPAPVPGSNNDTEYSSWLSTDDASASNGTGNGYVAYTFDERSIIQGTFRIDQNPIAQSPNLIKVQLNDEEYDHIADSLTVGDPVDATRIGQNINSTISFLGVPNVDQASRVVASYMAETFRGNPRDDDGGTLTASFQTTIQAAHLQMGDIVQLSYNFLGISNQLFRVVGVAPTQDYRRISLRLQWHDDRWYSFNYPLINPYALVDAGDVNGIRNPYPWQPYYVYAISFAGIGDPVYFTNGQRRANFGLALGVGEVDASDGTLIPAIIISGYEPVNVVDAVVPPPLLDRYATLASDTAGSIPNGTLMYVWVSCTDAQGNEGALSRVPSAYFVTSGTNTNSITLGARNYPAGATGIRIYTGSTADQPCFVTAMNSLPGAIAVSTPPPISSEAPVDVHCKEIVCQIKKLFCPGAIVLGPNIDTRTGNVTEVTVIGNTISQTSQSLTFPWAYDVYSNFWGWTCVDHAYDGFILMCIGNVATPTNGGNLSNFNSGIPWVTFEIAQNIGNQFYLNNPSGNIGQSGLFGSGSAYPDLTGTYWAVCNKLVGYDTTTFPGNAVLTFQLPVGEQNLAAFEQQLAGAAYAHIIEGPGAGTTPLRILQVGDFAPPPAGVTSYIQIEVAGTFSMPPVAVQSIVVFEEKTWRYSSTTPVNNSNRNTVVQIGVPLQNVSVASYYVEAVTEDSDGTMPANPSKNPYRLFWWPGQFNPLDMETAGLNLLANPGFEVAATLPQDYACADWRVDPGFKFKWGQAPQGVSLNGNTCLQGSLSSTSAAAPTIIPAGGFVQDHFTNQRLVSCAPGDTFFVSVAVISEPANNPGLTYAAGVFCSVFYTDGTQDDYFANNLTDLTGGWVEHSTTFQIRSDKTPVHVYTVIVVDCTNTNSTDYAIPAVGNPPSGGVNNTGYEWILLFDNAQLVRCVTLDQLASTSEGDTDGAGAGG